MNVTVPLPQGGYPVHIQPGALRQTGALLAPLGIGRWAVTADETVAALYGGAVLDSLRHTGLSAELLTFPEGERHKTPETWLNLCRDLAQRGFTRADGLLALGGGVTGDLAGFAAAILRRGVRFVQIPTSLLAQVDSSVGGKTGINSPHGKNLIGAFHQPALVLADIDVLSTLSPRDFRAGYGEVAKYGLLGDEGFFEWLEGNATGLASDAALRQHAVRHSVQMKADIVQRDETEQGDRALLNLGHTFGHALESATGYSDRLLHGEGVAIGCALAFELSAKMGLCSQEAPSRVAAHFAAMGLPSRIRDIPGDLPDDETLIALMGQDKKVQDGKLRFILARGIGRAFVTDAVDPAVLRQVLAQSR